jgi:SAM-dependent methyltransferase
MSAPLARDRWDRIYSTRPWETAGWYEPDPTTSRELIDQAVARGARSIIDIGGGASRLVDHLIDLDLDRVAVLDVSETGIAVARARLGDRQERVDWLIVDVTEVDDIGRFDVWHDRAAFHFLIDPDAQRRYVSLASRTVPSGGIAIIATFADDGPERCSGLPVQRYGPAELGRAFEPGFRLLDSRRHLHHTPAGIEQRFQYSLLERTDD